MKLSSSSIVGGRIGQVHACGAKGGSDQSPQLTIDDIPSQAQFVAIVWVHWNVFNVPATGKLQIGAGQKLSGDVGRTSGSAKNGYEGPCPPDGVHTYRFAVFATRDKVQVDTKAEWTIEAFEAKFGSQIVAKAVITGQFGP
jgi:Raf kinase inhibitor-like YbhB/YbcL family protein